MGVERLQGLQVFRAGAELTGGDLVHNVGDAAVDWGGYLMSLPSTDDFTIQEVDCRRPAALDGAEHARAKLSILEAHSQEHGVTRPVVRSAPDSFWAREPVEVKGSADGLEVDVLRATDCHGFTHHCQCEVSGDRIAQQRSQRYTSNGAESGDCTVQGELAEAGAE